MTGVLQEPPKAKEIVPSSHVHAGVPMCWYLRCGAEEPAGNWSGGIMSGFMTGMTGRPDITVSPTDSPDMIDHLA